MEQEIQPQLQQLNPIPPNNKNKIIIAVISLLVIVVLVTLGYFIFSKKPVETQTQELSQNLDVSSWKTYQNTQYGFEVQYPDGWSVYADEARYPESNSSDPRFSVTEPGSIKNSKCYASLIFKDVKNPDKYPYSLYSEVDKKQECQITLDSIISTFKFTAQNQKNQKLADGEEGCMIIPYFQGKLEFTDPVTDVRGGAICYFTIHKDLSTYTFHLIGNPEFNTIDRIEITKGNESAVSQTLEAGMGEPPYRDASFFVAEDMNFDGYKDIKLMSFWGATGNTGYTYWLFNFSKNLFVENKDLSSLSNPKPDVGTKTIATHSVGGMAGCIYNNGTYKFDETGKLILIREEKQDWVEASKSFLKTISELKNGKMVVSTEIGKCDNF